MRYGNPTTRTTSRAVLVMLLVLGLLAGIESPSGATDPPSPTELTAEAFLAEVAAAADACDRAVGRHDTTLAAGDRTYLVRELSALGSPARFQGTDADELIVGTDVGEEYIAGGGGSDIICGRGGDDLIYGYGGGGQETTDGSDILIGDAGVDILIGDSGSDRLFGDLDDLSLPYSEGSPIWGNRDGNDTGQTDYCLPFAPDRTHHCIAPGSAGEPETEVVRSGRAAIGLIEDVVELCASIDPLSHSHFTTFHGTTYRIIHGPTWLSERRDAGLVNDRDPEGREIVSLGSPQPVLIVGGAGDDHLRSWLGNDILCGGSGDDHLSSAHGADIVVGGPGRDAIDAGCGSDVVAGDDDDVMVNGDYPDPERVCTSEHDPTGVLRLPAPADYEPFDWCTASTAVRWCHGFLAADGWPECGPGELLEMCEVARPRSVEVTQGVTNQVMAVSGEAIEFDLGERPPLLVPNKATLFRFYYEGEALVSADDTMLVVGVVDDEGRITEHVLRPNVDEVTVVGGSPTATPTVAASIPGTGLGAVWVDGEAPDLLRAARPDLDASLNFVLRPEHLPDDTRRLQFSLFERDWSEDLSPLERLSAIRQVTDAQELEVLPPVRIGFNAVRVDSDTFDSPETRGRQAIEDAIAPYMEQALPISSFELVSFKTTELRSIKLGHVGDALRSGEPTSTWGPPGILGDKTCINGLWDYYLDGGYGGADDFTDDPSILPTVLIINSGARGCAIRAGTRASSLADLDGLASLGRTRLGDVERNDVAVGVLAPNLALTPVRGDVAAHETLHALGFLHATNKANDPALNCGSEPEDATDLFSNGSGGVTADSYGYIIGRSSDDRWAVYVATDANTSEIMSYCDGIGDMALVLKSYVSADSVVGAGLSLPSEETYYETYHAIVAATHERGDCPASSPSCDVDRFATTCAQPAIDIAIPGIDAKDWGLSHIGVPAHHEGSQCPVLAAFVGNQFVADLFSKLFGQKAGSVVKKILDFGASGGWSIFR